MSGKTFLHFFKVTKINPSKYIKLYITPGEHTKHMNNTITTYNNETIVSI